ncbi:MAG TPA: OmpA family protein [Mycobacteriales bacterium]|nr:OmpA family protein [Mycobacteriales bacterium]
MAHLAGYQSPGETHAAPAAAPRQRRGRHGPEAVLALQRAAGNASVNRLMVQRQSIGAGGGPGGGGGHFTSSASTETLTGFATGSAELTPEHQQVLDRIAADLNAQPLTFGGYLTLTGSADRRGDPGENQALGQRRADAVRDYLLGLVTDATTRQEIRAYSLGAPAAGPVADDPSMRKVEITITRRGYDLGLPDLTLRPPGEPAAPAPAGPDIFHLPPGSIPVPDPGHPQLPDWFWRELPPRPVEPSVISQISRWLNETLHTRDLARVAASIAGAFGFDRAQVQRLLDDAFQNGGETAVKELLNQMIRGAAGPPSGRPSSPYGPPVEPIPFPSPQLQLPPIRF